MTTVRELVPGDYVTSGGSSAVYILQAPHPVYRGLQLVCWRLLDGTLSPDALSADQEVGVVGSVTDQLRGRRLLWAVTGEGEVPT